MIVVSAFCEAGGGPCALQCRWSDQTLHLVRRLTTTLLGRHLMSDYPAITVDDGTKSDQRFALGVALVGRSWYEVATVVDNSSDDD
jgi:hypothetical protein